LIGRDSSDARDIVLGNAGGVGERRRIAAEQGLAGALHTATELLTMSLDVLVDRALDELSLLQPRHQRRVADLKSSTARDPVRESWPLAFATLG
jgi:hypothetical protein